MDSKYTALTEIQEIQLLSEYNSGRYTQEQLAMKWNIGRATVQRVIYRRRTQKAS